MSEASETIMESREGFMVSPVGDSKPTLRTAFFLKPTVADDGPISKIPLSLTPPLPPIFEPKKWPLTVKFTGWRYKLDKWIQWVDSLHSTYESVWRKVGIYEAIMSTKINLLKNEELLFGITERWCCKTNTFVFPWAEATITLEDIMALGGYPVLGAFVFCPLETPELKEVEEKLILARKEILRTKGGKASISIWMNIFMDSGREIEHEAFLAAWLSIFVLPEKSNLVRELIFPIAIHLAIGNPIALAPAVLATIYKDLSILKQTIVNLATSRIDGDKEPLELTLRSPFYLVQIWVWERLEVLRPKPKLISHDDPFLGRWHKVQALKVDNVRSVLDSARDEFVWRPYARFAPKHKLFYPENPMCVRVGHSLDKDIICFIKCMRVSELVGFYCIEQYLPHRVAMQFGMDQDIPGHVIRINETPELAWANYSRPITDSNVYIPSRFFEADVTTRYVEWWNKSVLGYQDPVKNLVQGKRSKRPSKKRGNDADVPPGFTPKCSMELGRSNGHGNDESDLHGVLPSSVAADKTEILMANRTEKLEQREKVNVVGGSKRAKEDTKGYDMSSFVSTADYRTMNKMELQMKPLPKVESETSKGVLEEATEDTNASQKSSSSNTIDRKIMVLENRISRLERLVDELKIRRFSNSSQTWPTKQENT